jgi:hypothetical protein
MSSKLGPCSNTGFIDCQVATHIDVATPRQLEHIQNNANTDSGIAFQIVGCNVARLSEAKRCAELLESPQRHYGAKITFSRLEYGVFHLFSPIIGVLALVYHCHEPQNTKEFHQLVHSEGVILRDSSCLHSLVVRVLKNLFPEGNGEIRKKTRAW